MGMVGDRCSKPTMPHHIHIDKILAISGDDLLYKRAIGD
jgi:hypothetical protein